MSEIKDRQDAASAIDPIVTAQADEILAPAATAAGSDGAAATDDIGAMPRVGPSAEPAAVADIADAIEAALLDDATEPLAATSFDHLPAAYSDTIVELDPEAGLADDDAPLLDVELEDGIASVFAALHAARDDASAAEATGDPEAADIVTFRLLGELDRLWHRAA